MNELIEQLLKKPYATIIEFQNAYNIGYITLNKYIRQNKVKIIKRGARCTYKVQDVHQLLSELGYPKLTKPKERKSRVLTTRHGF